MNSIMHLNEDMYRLVKDGRKTMELRLMDGKRSKLLEGDKITFINRADDNDRFDAYVIKLHKAANFTELADIIDFQATGSLSREGMIKGMYKHYPHEKQALYGVVAIEVKKT